MRNLAFLIPTILCLGIGLGCEQSKRGLTESHGVLVEDVAETADDTLAATTSAHKRPASQTTATAWVANCNEREEDNPFSEDPIIVRTCTYNSYQSVATGMPDYKGRYSWEYALYKSEDNAYIAIPNALLFNEERDKLLQQINLRIMADYRTMAEDPENESCFDVKELSRPFNYEELGISFEEDRLVFHVDFEMPDHCMAVGGTSVAFKLKEIAAYLQQ